MKKLLLILIPSLSFAARGPSDHFPTGLTLAPANNVWYIDVTSAVVSSSNTAWMDILNGHTGHNFHANFGTTLGDGSYNGIPYNLVWSTATARKSVPITTYAVESDTQPDGGIPIPSDVIAEGDPVADVNGDRHLLIVDVSSGMIYEMNKSSRTGGGNWTANQLTIWHSTTNVLRTDGWTSADAAGLPITIGLLRWEEVDPVCNINHAIRMELELTKLNSHIWPARHDTSTGDSDRPPFGMRVRMNADVDLSVLSDTHSICIFNALKRYGAILADNGGDWYIDGAPNPNWDNTKLHDDFITVGLPHDTMKVTNQDTWVVWPDSAVAHNPTQDPPGLTVTDTGTGITETVTIESANQFRLVWEADDNWGLSQWYDLVNDPLAATNLAGPLYAVNGPSEPCFAEPGLQNMTLYGDSDMKAYMREAGCNYSTESRSMTIIYQSTGMVVLQTSGHPMDAIPEIDTHVTFTHKFYVFPSGKIYVHNTLTTANAIDLGAGGADLFIATMGLEDPTQTGTSPPDTRGWIRAAADANPYEYLGSQENYVFAYWAATTTGTYANHTNASIMLVPSPNNPTSLFQIVHSWSAGAGHGVVRWGYRYSPGPNMSAGQTITNEFLLQLGAENSSYLPNITTTNVGDSYSSAFIADPTFPTVPSNATASPVPIKGKGSFKGKGRISR